MSSIWAYWAPPNERSRLTGIANAGSWFGSIIALPLAGYLCANGGWHSIFYIFSVLSFIWCILFMILCSDKPDEHRFISYQEKIYINASLSVSGIGSKTMVF
jgi:ACS family sodium-dependent inorganic phosphate cotransporter